MEYKLPAMYDILTPSEKRAVRNQYVKLQENKCLFCKTDLTEAPAEEVLAKPINLRLFPIGFLDWPIHLQHDHNTGLTEGAVHAYCNAVLWQYFKK